MGHCLIVEGTSRLYIILATLLKIITASERVRLPFGMPVSQQILSELGRVENKSDLFLTILTLVLYSLKNSRRRVAI